MSEIKSLAAPKASFDRRAVVKGAAWSVPVIAAAIAAPAAAASHHTYSAALIAGTGLPTIAGTPQMSGTGLQGFAVATTGATFTGAVSVVINVQPDAATAATGVGLAVTAAALPPSGQSAPYNFAYSRTGTGNVASDAVLKYTVTVTVTVVESATKSTVLPAMAFVATLKPVTTLSLVTSSPAPLIGGTPESIGTGQPQSVVVTTTGTALSAATSMKIDVQPDPAGTEGVILLVSASQPPSPFGKSASFNLTYNRSGGNGTIKNVNGVKFTVTVTVFGAEAAGLKEQFVVTLKKK